MKFDAAVFLRRQTETVVASTPVPAGLRANRSIVALGVQTIRSNIGHQVANAVVGIAVGGVPIGDHAVGRRRSPASDLVEFFTVQRAIRRHSDRSILPQNICETK